MFILPLGAMYLMNGLVKFINKFGPHNQRNIDWCKLFSQAKVEN